ncbi:hypothetical protein [Streptomyces sp. YIM 130001]|uniref:hypothetical protein n=1 Tax=Streptomyces sp. YIM 130001 TaxID=2259644 RepID=UPI0013C414DD|nr:hypothetical protein [Streptomyces sp. YIM 130001]
MFLIAGCSNDLGNSADSKEAPSKTPQATKPQASPTPTSPEDTAKRELSARYDAYQEELAKAYGKASTKGTKVNLYATGVAFATTQGQMRVLQKAGQSTSGTPRAELENASFDLDRTVPKATAKFCSDVSDWKLLDRKTKKEADLPEGRFLRYITVVTAEKWPKYGWMVLEEKN